ncbi:hypothetical protein SAMN04488591_0118 [Microbacterium azadirachtae]|uniref:Uncharacterized protein n=1 Tax=Microbacterium azadirachtae TaxID=582680 RepID=A0A1I6FPR3_9MICO|nr:hypothetical protein [Microbacterium azadirachtae]SFR31931.1 hypothetical protein SAMN04488591_0118 [Microbacterium azadirachtae]
MTSDAPFAETTQDDDTPTPAPESLTGDALPEDALPAAAPQPGYFGFTLRELIIVGLWLLAFVLSFVPAAGSVLDGSATVWTMNGAWLLAIGVPTVAVFLIVLRRLSPEGIRRVGSLGIDQFASVAFSVALVNGGVLLWQQLDLVAAQRRSALTTWPLWLELLFLLGLVVVTVFATLIPGIREDFEGRTDTLAHRSANPVRPVFTRPRPVRARGSVSDPQNEDDVDPGLLHENEVGANAHLSAGTTGAAIAGAAGYVPEHHRESFLASAETSEGGAPVGAGAADALTEAIPDAGAPTIADDTAEPVVPAAAEDDAVPGDVDSAEPSTADDAPAEAEAAPRDLSDTMTEVLGDLLEPAPAEDVATHAVDVVVEDAAAAPSGQSQPFWALAPDTRAVHDARGDEIFTIGPDAWILVLEDRGGAFVVRHDDGRVGYLHDTDNMTRG